jgi:hypothetical protein
MARNETGGFEEEGVRAERPTKSSMNLNREVNVKINPAKIGKLGLVIVVLLAVFFLGRLSANNFELTGLATAEVDTVKEKIVEEAPTVEEDTAVEEVLDEVEEVPKVVDKRDEKIVTTYKNVKVQLHEVNVEWKETWGKITGLRYTITNGEDGTILPDHFLIMVEGYKDVEKEAFLEEDSKKITSGQIQSGTVTLEKPFNYNEVTTGKLDDVQVRIVLFDTDGKPMASFQKEFDLEG